MTRTHYWLTALPLAFALGCSSDSGDLDGGGGGGNDAGDTTGADAGDGADAGELADAGEEVDAGEGGDLIDPETEPFRTIRDPGFLDERLDIVIVGDGYTLEELGTTFAAHANLIGEEIFERKRNNVTEPFRAYREFFRVHRVHLASNESGVDSDGVEVDTALDGATTCAGGLGGGVCYVDVNKVHDAIDAALAGADFTVDWRVVVLNTDEKVGGALEDPRGNIAVFAGGFGGNADYLARQLALRELAHAFANAGYEFGGDPATYDGAEPTEVNLTTDPTGAKWARWDGFDERMDGLAAIGAVEGGGGFDRGIYRPTPDSNMGELNGGDTRRFNAVVTESLVMSFYEPITIIGSKDPPEDNITDPVVMFVQSVDRDRTEVEWTVNGTVAEGYDDFAFGFEAYAAENNLPAGDYQVTGRVYDDTGWVRMNPRGPLEDTATWTVTRTR